MAAKRRRSNPDLIAQLQESPRTFEFMQVVRLLQSALAEDKSGGQHQSELDYLRNLEFLRFSATPSLSFPDVEVEGIAGDGSNGPRRVSVNFLGLTGPSGVLPRHYTFKVMHQLREGDSELADFFDLFNHRLVTLFFQAAKKYRAIEQIESRHWECRDGLDAVTFALLSIVGFGTEDLRDRLSVADDLFLHFAGHYQRRPGNPSALQSILSAVTKASVRVIQFQGRWLALEPEIQTQFRADQPARINVQLGRGAIAGSRVWDVESKFRIRIGPLNYASFRSLIPSGADMLRIGQIVRTYVGIELDFDMQLILKRSEVPPCKLDGTLQLGWNTWSLTRQPAEDVDDAIFDWITI